MKVAAAINSSMDTVFFRSAYAAMNCVYKGALAAVHLRKLLEVTFGFQGYSVSLKQVLPVIPLFKGYFAIPVAVIPWINAPFSIMKEQLQPCILSNLLCFFRKRFRHVYYLLLFL